MKRINFFYTYAMLFTLAPLSVLAQRPDGAPTQTVLANILTLLNLVIQILITLSFVVFGWGIVKFIYSAGNPQKLKDAKSILLWGVIGIFILASLGGIIAFIKTYIGVPANPIIPAPTFTSGS